MDCIFCKIISGELPCYKVYENESVFVFLDIGPVSPGHTLFVPRRHATNLNEGSAEEAVELMKAVYMLAPAIIKAVGASGYNLGMNHGLAAGQDVMHTHLHLMPRVDGVARTFVKTNPTQEELAEVAMKIRNLLLR
jgi:histidine triad (HIT) family protein